MNTEKLYDAIGYIDDDIVAETEAFSKRKKSVRRVVATAVSLAACLVIAFFGTHIVKNSQYFVSPDRGSSEHMSFTSTEKKWSGYAEKGEQLYGCATTGTIASKDNAVLLEITEWRRNCFYALVLEGDSDELSIGTKVKVKVDKNVWFGHLDSCKGSEENFCKGAEENYYKQGKPTEEDFPVGSKVYVVYDKIRNSFFNSKASKVLRAESVKMVRTHQNLRGPGSMMTYYYVEIKEWDKDSFKGIIKGSENNVGEIPLDNEVTVCFDGKIVVRKEGEKLQYRKPTPEDFPVGNRVKVLVNDMYAPQYLGQSEIWISSIGDLTELQTAVVRIEEWNDKGFEGTLQGENGQSKFYYTSHNVTVKFTDETRMKSFDNKGTTTISLAPTEEDFPVGSVVEVSYNEAVQKTDGETVFIAERVWRYEVTLFASSYNKYILGE